MSVKNLPISYLFCHTKQVYFNRTSNSLSQIASATDILTSKHKENIYHIVFPHLQESAGGSQ
jgi:adenine C2-methylase RlmN of 23S rRNA A2503 and tRNA A37